MAEETLRLQFGAAANTLGTQWLALQRANILDDALMQANGMPRLVAFEAKGRVQRQLAATCSTPTKAQEEQTTWGGNVQVYDQSSMQPPAPNVPNSGLWDWHHCRESNLFEVPEFRAHMPLHNFYDGYSASNGGSIANTTLDDVEDRVRTTLETCDRLRLVQCLVDMDSSFGGLALETMTYVREECPGAVVAMFGNDWSYPLASDDADALFRVAPESRDQSKVEARKRINVASSMALLSEVANIVVPLAMTEQSLPSSRFASLRFQRSQCADVATVVATALELALSAHRGHSALEALEGLTPSMKIVELAASFPHPADPMTLLQSIVDEAMNMEGQDSESQAETLFKKCSLLPEVGRISTRQSHERASKVFYRRLHFCGQFNDYPGLRTAIKNAPLSPRDVTLQWSDAVPLQLPQDYRVRSLAGVSTDAISQLELSSRTGKYLKALAQQAGKSDKRTLYEFTRAGMSPDAPEELEATLAGMGDAYYPQ